jgi:hypothetical protein
MIQSGVFLEVHKYPLKPAQGPRNRGGNGGICPPPTFLKVKKVPFSGAKVPHLQNEKSISFAGKKVPFLQ